MLTLMYLYANKSIVSKRSPLQIGKVLKGRKVSDTHSTEADAGNLGDIGMGTGGQGGGRENLTREHQSLVGELSWIGRCLLIRD